MVLRFPFRRPHSCARRSLFWEENWKVPEEEWTHQMQLRIDGVWSISNRNWNNRSFLFPTKEEGDGNISMMIHTCSTCVCEHACVFPQQKGSHWTHRGLLFRCKHLGVMWVPVHRCTCVNVCKWVYTWQWCEGHRVPVISASPIRWWWRWILVFLVLGATGLGVWVNVSRYLIGIPTVVLKQTYKTYK